MARRRVLIWAVVTGLAWTGQLHADKLVVFHNGRTLHVEEVRSEGEWFYLTLGKKSEMGVPAGLVSRVTEIQSKVEARLPNVQAAAGGGGDAAAAPPPRPRLSAAAEQEQDGSLVTQEGTEPQDLAEQEQLASDARNDALARAAARARRGALGRVPDPESPPADGEAAAPGLELGGNQGAWPSLLERGRRGRSRGSEPTDEQPREEGDEPER